MLKALYANQLGLKPNLPDLSIYLAMTFNLGPKTVTLDPNDKGNTAYGLCAITALGQEGRLTSYSTEIFSSGVDLLNSLWGFCPWSVRFTPIEGQNACSMSLTRYCAGGLFRWV